MSPPPSLPSRRLGRLRIGTLHLHYEVTGEGPALVFAHGLGGNQLSWWQQVAYFAPRYACITFAHRGFAPSSGLSSGPDPADYAGDLAALIDHLGLPEVSIVAQSMGGWTAVEYALERTGKLKALVLASTTGTIDSARIREPERARLRAWEVVSERAQADCIGRAIHVAAGKRMAAEQPALHLLYRHIDDMNADLDKAALRGRLTAGRTRAPEELAGALCPVLFIVGDEDILIPPFAADAIAAVVPGARVLHVANAGHSVYFERAQVFNRHVAEFLERVF
jgi:pimeloyl-ACP methyl ester carboxylesterase